MLEILIRMETFENGVISGVLKLLLEVMEAFENGDKKASYAVTATRLCSSSTLAASVFGQQEKHT